MSKPDPIRELSREIGRLRHALNEALDDWDGLSTITPRTIDLMQAALKTTEWKRQAQTERK